jgi:hypothetical protein
MQIPSLLDIEIQKLENEGYSMFEKLSGAYTLTPQSRLGAAIRRAKRKGYQTLAVAKGGKVGAYKNDGFHMALMVK